MGGGAICNSPDSSIGAFHIHFHFQENISAETGILGTFAGAFRGVEPGLRSQRVWSPESPHGQHGPTRSNNQFCEDLWVNTSAATEMNVWTHTRKMQVTLLFVKGASKLN